MAERKLNMWTLIDTNLLCCGELVFSNMNFHVRVNGQSNLASVYVMGMFHFNFVAFLKKVQPRNGFQMNLWLENLCTKQRLVCS